MHWVWEEGHVLGGHCGGVASGCYVDVVDSCVDCVNAYVRQYTDRNKVLHQYMYVVMVMV